MKKLLLAALAVAALAPAAAAGGGFATVGLSSLPPAEVRAGTEWAVDLTVLQHGRTPLESVQPLIRLRGPDGGLTELAAARTDTPGVYHAVVRFPSAGTWTYEIWDGFSQTHTYKPVEVLAPTAAPAGFPALPVAGLALGLVLAAALVYLLRRARSASQPVPLRH